MAALPLSVPVFSILSSLIEDVAGLHYSQDNLELLADKVSIPAREAGFESLLDYYYYLRYDPEGPDALAMLVESLLVHETYFFREAPQLTGLVTSVLVPAVKEGKRLRVWSAACATGEEPLTLAMILVEHSIGSEVELVASDLSQAALNKARRGEFTQRSLRALPAPMRKRWFEESGGVVTLRPELRERVQWRRVNLLDEAQVKSLGLFDAILCRNVLIYFKDDTALKVVGLLSDALRPGGHLVVGTSESLLRFGTQLSCEERGGSFFYTKGAS